MIAVDIAPPPAMVAPVRARQAAREHQSQFDQDQQTLTGQAYLRTIRWRGMSATYNPPPLVAVLDTGVAPRAAGLTNRIDTQWAKSFAFGGGGDPLTDSEGHGTVVAGIISTVASGAEGAPGALILPIQVAGPTGQTSAPAVAEGIRYAIARRARIINLSLQGAGFSKIEQDAINAAVRAGILVVASAGNSGSNAREYPGAYRHVLAVGATDVAGNALPETTRGMQVAVAAPGGVTVKAQQAQPFKLSCQLLHHPLGARAEGFEGRGATVAAAITQLGAVVAPVAAQPLLASLGAVHGEGHIAMGAEHRFAAAAAAQESSVAAAGHQHHGLLALLLQLLEPPHQGPADQAAVAVRELVAHVDHPYGRQGPRTNPLRQS
jgi:hypothetical protein